MAHNRTEQRTGLEGQHQVVLSDAVAAAAMRDQPLLEGLLATAAGYFPKATGHLCRRPKALNEAILIYCVKGGGWCETARRLHTVRQGDLLVLPPGLTHNYGAHVSNPWTLHWVHCRGNLLPDYLKKLGVSPQNPVLSMGDDLQIARLFNEILQALDRGPSFVNLLRASHTLAYLLAVMIGHRHERKGEATDGVQRVAQAIIYMSEHLDQPLRVAALAALAGFSSAHFNVLFKQQTGCSPRDYLHLLRIHSACQLLRGSTLPVKEVAAKLGYIDPFHFSRQFKAFQGVSPTEYREGRGG